MSNAARELTTTIEGNSVTMQERSNAITPMEMLNTALSRGADIGVLEKLMALQERWEASQARKAFDAAIAKAKGEIGPVLRNAKGHNDKRYADFAQIARTVDPVLASHGLTYRFRTEQTDRIHVTCILSHRDGHSETTTLAGPPDGSGSKNAIQAIGSTLTYLQRYSLIQMLGLASSNDDDGKSAMPPGDPEDLRATGERIAKEEGFAALGLWWKTTLTQADRKALGPETLNNLKAIAEGAI
jgi:hypothetical protein